MALAIAVIAGACSSATAPPAGHALTLQGRALTSCTLTGTRGLIVAALCGTLSVAEDPTRKGGRKIDLFVAVKPAREPGPTGPPVFFIAGGPGGVTTADWAEAPIIFSGLNDHHDLVLVDQRGTGRSHEVSVPNPDPGEAPADFARRVLAALDGDPRFYTTAVAVDDLDAVRAALGYSKIDLYGGSYGATAVQYYIRRHGEHVAAAVLDGGTRVDVPILELIAKNSQLALDDVLDRCARETPCRTAFPNVRAELRTILARLAAKPVKTDVTDPEGNPIVFTPDVFAGTLHSLLVGSESGSIPWLIHQASTGDLLSAAVALSRYLGTPGARTLMMQVEILCSEAWARNDPANIAATGKGSYMLANQLSIAAKYATACRYAPPGYVSADDAQPVSTTAPVLLLNGSDDPQDPPANVAGYETLMPNALLVVAPGQGHTVAHIGCLPKVVVRFFDSGQTDPEYAQTCTASMSPPEFRLA
ncbi:MAG TPA: alpha/beta hydrolase [Candidatus Dormibacteraeota bacterium]|nr:alpha/beta hydrolase [Candidatus Dormibacteraeota bacterium]